MNRTIVILACAVIGLLLPAGVHAQSAPRSAKWTIQFYGGGSTTSSSASGSPVEGFSVGTPFVMLSGTPTRSVSSWYFGDGALLLNQTLAEFSRITGTSFPTITPLDAALLNSGGSRGGSSVFGMRVGRAVSDHLAIELSVERVSSLQLTDELETSLRESSESFKAAFDALFASAPTGNPNVTSMLTLREGSGQTRITASANWTVLNGNRWEAFLTGGGGITFNGSEGPSAVLNGRYRFAYLNLYPFDETDRVAVTVAQPKSTALGLIGAGIAYDLFSSIGLRADVRLLLNSTKDVTRITSAPNLAVTNQVNVMATVTSPGLQFSTTPGVRSSLSGANESITLFRASGFSKQVAASVGIFKRF